MSNQKKIYKTIIDLIELNFKNNIYCKIFTNPKMCKISLLMEFNNESNKNNIVCYFDIDEDKVMFVKIITHGIDKTFEILNKNDYTFTFKELSNISIEQFLIDFIMLENDNHIKNVNLPKIRNEHCILKYDFATCSIHNYSKYGCTNCGQNITQTTNKKQNFIWRLLNKNKTTN